MTSLNLLGTGSYAPAYTVTNDDFARFLDTSDEWIATRTGMKRRHIAVDEPAWHMGAVAARRAMENAGVGADEIDLVLGITCTSDFQSPAMANLIQRELGIESAFSFDVNAACAGFITGMDMARNYLLSGGVKRVLLVAAENLSQYVDYTDRSMCVLFGDAAGACVLGAAEGLYGSYQLCDIAGTHHIYNQKPRRSTPFGRAAEKSPFDPFPMEVCDNLTMNGREVYKFASKAMPAAIEKACENAGVAVANLDRIFPHQANLRILQAAAKNMGMAMDRMYVNIEEYGNTSSATIPIGLDECIRAGKLRRGELICLVGFGAGLTLGATVFRY
jgi:3-oxoacyl-[acyl-carrier-protein] synthase-3